MHVTLSLDDQENIDYKPPFMRCTNTEGTARYVEFNLHDNFSTKLPDAEMLKSDTLYQNGFNMLRLLNHLNTDYKPRLFRGSLSLEDLLRVPVL